MVVRLHSRVFPQGSYFQAKDLMTHEEVWKICVNHNVMFETGAYKHILGCESVEGLSGCLSKTIKSWRHSRDFIVVLHPTPEELMLRDQADLDFMVTYNSRELKKQQRHVTLTKDFLSMSPLQLYVYFSPQYSGSFSR